MNQSLKYLKQLLDEFRNIDAKILIYGCNGYTATIILQLLSQLDFPSDQFIFAARNPLSLSESLVQNLGEQYSKVRVVSFAAKEDEIKRVFEKEKFSVVLNCAGPFEETARQFISLCAAYGVSYVDITGEVPVFEYALNNAALVKLVGVQQIVIMPGVGFDVVPSDCLLKKTTEEYQKKYGQLPHKLEIMIAGLANKDQGVGLSHGTKKTMLRGFMKSNPVTRLNGKFLPPVELAKDFPMRYAGSDSEKRMKGFSIPWGDISTGYHSTGVPNIHTFMPGIYPNETVAKMFNSTILCFIIRFLLSLPFMLRVMEWFIKRAPAGPSEDARNIRTGSMYAIATNEDGTKSHAKYLFVKEGYQLTAETALASALLIALKKTERWGCLTPSCAFGSDFITRFDKCSFHEA